VILQQGPSALPESQVCCASTRASSTQHIRRVGAKTALYMVWPFSTRRGDFDGVKASYQAAARDVGGLFLPVGEAWRAVWRRDAKISLYGSDGFHPHSRSDVSRGARDLSAAHGTRARRPRRPSMRDCAPTAPRCCVQAAPT
jgi:hypothetical protein